MIPMTSSGPSTVSVAGDLGLVTLLFISVGLAQQSRPSPRPPSSQDPGNLAVVQTCAKPPPAVSCLSCVRTVMTTVAFLLQVLLFKNPSVRMLRSPAGTRDYRRNLSSGLLLIFSYHFWAPAAEIPEPCV